MTDEQIDEHAAAMYTRRCVPQGPPWHQLGDTTKGLWREIALSDLCEGLA